MLELGAFLREVEDNLLAMEPDFNADIIRNGQRLAELRRLDSTSILLQDRLDQIDEEEVEEKLKLEEEKKQDTRPEKKRPQISNNNILEGSFTASNVDSSFSQLIRQSVHPQDLASQPSQNQPSQQENRRQRRTFQEIKSSQVHATVHGYEREHRRMLDMFAMRHPMLARFTK